MPHDLSSQHEGLSVKHAWDLLLTLPCKSPHNVPQDALVQRPWCLFQLFKGVLQWVTNIGSGSFKCIELLKCSDTKRRVTASPKTTGEYKHRKSTGWPTNLWHVYMEYTRKNKSMFFLVSLHFARFMKSNWVLSDILAFSSNAVWAGVHCPVPILFKGLFSFSFSFQAWSSKLEFIPDLIILQLDLRLQKLFSYALWENNNYSPLNPQHNTEITQFWII